MRTRPVEEAEGFSAGIGAATEDAVDEFGVDIDWHFIQGSFHVNVAPDDVGDVVNGREVIVFRDGIGGFGGIVVR